jgi:hypothetical protein
MKKSGNGVAVVTAGKGCLHRGGLVRCSRPSMARERVCPAGATGSGGYHTEPDSRMSSLRDSDGECSTTLER